MAPAEIRSYDDLLDAARTRKAELDITFATLDLIAGIQDGYAAKLLGPRPARKFGLMSLPTVFAALGLRLTVIPDDEALARVESRLVKRRCKLAKIDHWRNRRAAAVTQAPSAQPANFDSP